MADVRASRRALLAARTRKRNESIRGAPPRQTSARRELKRIEEGRPTLSEAFGGVPSKSVFLKQAHLFERRRGSDAVERAFIVPGDGLESLKKGERRLLYWYRRDSSFSPPPFEQAVISRTAEGEVFRVTCLQNIAAPHVGVLEGKKVRRTCTGSAVFLVE